MKLHQYLTETQITPAQFAGIIGCSRETVRRYISGERIPDKDTMPKIALATGCKVTANDFFGIAA